MAKKKKLWMEAGRQEMIEALRAEIGSRVPVTSS